MRDRKSWGTVSAMTQFGKLSFKALDHDADGQIPLERLIDTVRRGE